MKIRRWFGRTVAASAAANREKIKAPPPPDDAPPPSLIAYGQACARSDSVLNNLGSKGLASDVRDAAAGSI